MRKMRSAYNIAAEKHEGKRPLGRPRHRWEDKINIILKKECESEYWVRLARNLVTVTCVNAVIKPVP